MKNYEAFPIYITNSLSGKKERFEPLHAGKVGMYVCGPTVYNDVHLGNVRTFICFDVIARYLRHMGYKLRYVRNITDVGHLESDHDEGEDKILKKARLESLEPMEVVQRYTDRLHDTLARFNVLPPSIEPSATGHILEQITFIEKLIEEGFAYVTNGSVYFDVARFDHTHGYGLLSGRVIEEMMASGRQLDGQDEKRNNIDFALWKKASPRHIMRWPSPWGMGFPGWHIECSAMSAKYLGSSFDIHGGGMDLKFPHHDCEIAQSVAATGKKPARYWIHSNMLTVDGQKMSKSLGNSLLPEELLTGRHPRLKRGFDAMTVRFFILQSHYSSTLDISSEALAAAEKGYKKLVDAFALLGKVTPSPSVDKELKEQACHHAKEAYRNMSDDFNTAKTLATLFDMATLIRKLHNEPEKGLDKKTLEHIKAVYTAMLKDVLGIWDGSEGTDDLVSGIMDIVLDLRNKARRDKNFALSDTIRDRLQDIGIQLKDGQRGEVSYTIVKR